MGVRPKRRSPGHSSDRKHETGAAAPGREARALAHHLLTGVLLHRRPFEQVLADLADRSPEMSMLEPRDRAFARILATTVLRRHRELEHVLHAFLERPLPKDAGRVWVILLMGAAQIVCLGTPAHAAVDTAVEAVRRERGGARFAGLANAVLRRVADRRPLLETMDRAELNIPAWLLKRWRTAYGNETAQRIAKASLKEAALDISIKPGASRAEWAERLGGQELPTGSIRLAAHGRIEDLPGYAEGVWWVQDAAAALVSRAAGEVSGRLVADLCAAPGGKTAALAASGAAVTAVDISPQRLGRLRANLERLSLSAAIVAADVISWTPEHSFDVVILDAPCTATGTIRRHPDILFLKRPEDVGRMADVQQKLLAQASRLVRPSGVLVYSTCSLEPEEGERQVEAFLAVSPGFRREPIDAGELDADPSWITPAGELRTLPHYLELEPPGISGIDGFYVARLRRHT